MPKSFSAELGAWKASVERRLDNLSSGNRLDHASLDGTTLYLKGDGQLGRIGRQPDGSNGVHVVKVQPPPQLTAPILTVGEQAGTCLVEWDGGTFDGRRMPLIHGHTEIWAELVDADWSPTVAPGDTGKRVGTIRDRTGGEVVVALPQAGTWAVWLRAMGADRETAGPWSPVSQVDIKPLVDTDAIEAELEEARDRLEQAEQDLAAGMAERAAEIEYLRETRIPELQQALDNIQPVIDDYDDRIQSAQDGAQSARDTAENLRDNVLPPLQGEIVDLTENRLPAVEGTLDDTRLGMENLRDVRLPDLQDTLNSGLQDANEWREVGAISADSVRIGSYANLFTDPHFDYIAANGSVDNRGPWRTLEGSATAFRKQPSSTRPPRAIASAASWRADGYNRLRYSPGRFGIPVTAGEEYTIALRFWGGSNPRGMIRAEYRDENGGSVSGTVQTLITGTVSSSDQLRTASWTVPEGTSLRFMTINFFLHGGDPGTAYFTEPLLRQRVDGNLLVDGAVQARHIMAEEIAGAVGQFLELTADQIDTESLAAYLATIIELDAGQITSGKINTSRLDAQEVAGAVANFLTLDALEINVEQLAGEIANIIEVTAESIAAGAISARHLAIADFENFGPSVEAIQEFHEGGFAGSNFYSVQNGGAWTTIANQGDRLPVAVRINDRTSSDALSRMAWRPVGVGVPVRPGDQFRFSGYGWASGNSGIAYPEIRIVERDANQNYLGYGDGRHVFTAGWGTFSIDKTVTYSNARFIDVEFYCPSGAVNRGYWGEFSFRRKSGGELIVDGGVKARNLDVEEIFSTRAIIEKVWADVVYSELVQSQGIITEDMIATGAITTPKLTVTEEMVGQIARLIRVEAGSLASNDIEAMRIVSSLIEATTYLIHNAAGDVSVRLDGMDNYLAGRLHAGMTETEGIVLDWGEKVRYSGLTEEGDPAPDRTIKTPYLNFHTDDVDYLTGSEPSIHLDRDDPSGRSGMMVINPGYPVGTDTFRGKLNVVGDVQSNRFEPRERLQINTSHPDQPGVLQSSGQGLRIRGQIPSSSHSQEMFYVGQTDLATLAAGGRRKRTLSWGVPVPRGRRDPIGTVYLQGASSNNNARVEMNVSQRTTTSYRLDEYNNSSVDAGYWVGIIAPWRDV